MTDLSNVIAFEVRDHDGTNGFGTTFVEAINVKGWSDEAKSCANSVLVFQYDFPRYSIISVEEVPAVTCTSSEPLYHVNADAHHAVLDGSDKAIPLIDSMIARLQRAKAAHEAGDKVTASREFDPRYVVKGR